MEKYYWNNETDEVMDLGDIRRDYYDVFEDPDELSFDEYLARCMSYNNGVLRDVSDKYQETKDELNRKLILARKYGYDEYADELVNLLGDLHRYGKYTRSEGRR